jgi:hypothetical protein
MPYITPLIVKGELAITSSRSYLEFLLQRYISGADVSRENVLRGMLQGTPLKILPNMKKSAPPIRTA